MLLETQISRRGFLQASGALTFSFTFAGKVSNAVAQAATATFNAWVSIAADDTVTVMIPSAEMGQGVLTSLPLILAEELDADWAKVTTQYAPPNPKIYGNYHRLFNGAMLDAGSLTVPGFWTPLRMGGAQARRVLMENVARQWNVPLEELSTEPSVVVHAKSGRRISYGEVVKFATLPAEPPKLGEADLKKPAQFRLIGKDMPRVDVPSKVDGSAKYGIDVRLPGMVYASVLESPMEGAKVVESEHRRGAEDQGRDPRDPDALRRRGDRRHRTGDAQRPPRAQGRLGLLRRRGQGLRFGAGQGRVRAPRQGSEYEGAGMVREGRRARRAGGRRQAA